VITVNHRTDNNNVEAILGDWLTNAEIVGYLRIIQRILHTEPERRESITYLLAARFLLWLLVFVETYRYISLQFAPYVQLKVLHHQQKIC
jgi:hypothetical protein